MVGTWILPCLSVPREGSGGGTEEGQPLTHTEPGLLGDRTSGFNGLRTSGPLGCAQEGSREVAKARGPPHRRRASPGCCSSTSVLSSSPGHLAAASWASQRQVRVGQGCPGSRILQAVPLGAGCPCSTWRGSPKHSSVLRLPKLLIGASVLTPVPVVCPSVHLTRGRGSEPGLGLSVFPKAGQICPHALALHAPRLGRGPWPP